MNLRELAALDHRTIVEDVNGGFARELRFIDPDGRDVVLNGFWNDVAQNIDLETGAMVAGRVAFVRVTRGALRAAGLSLPFGDLDTMKKPWRVEYTPLAGGEPKRWHITEARPDRSIDAVDCYLSEYR
jgi:hypothetical protein